MTLQLEKTEGKAKLVVLLVENYSPLRLLEGGQPEILGFKSSSRRGTGRNHRRSTSPYGCTGGSGSGDNGNDDPSPPDYSSSSSVEPKPTPIDPNITLASVGGLAEHIKYLKRAVVYPLKHQGSLNSWGVDAPKGIMLHGPPGTGKTLLAKALANELSKALDKKFSFFYQKGGECFGKYFGESQRNLQELFQAADHYKPSVIFFDEIDGLCPDRNKTSSTSEAYATVVTALLGLMDSVKRGEVFIIGATNRLDSVDAAVRRPGRFDKQLTFSLPNEDERKDIIKIHTKKWPHDHPTGALLTYLSKKTNGYTGADLQKACTDVVHAAMTRTDDDEGTRILPKDWESSLQNMKRSNVNVFGSALFIPDPISPVLSPLVSNTVKEIVSLLKPLIPEKKSPSKDFSLLSRNSFLIWDMNSESEHFTNYSIIRSGVLSDQSLQQFPTYILDEDIILRKLAERNTLIGVVNQILEQVQSSDKPSILFIQRIDRLEGLMHQQKLTTTFYRQLKRLRGDDVLLIATTANGLADLSIEIADLFLGQDRSYAVRGPNKKERTCFYQQVFDELIESGEQDLVPAKKTKSDKEVEDVDLGDEFDDQLERAVLLTGGVNVDFMLMLHDALNLKKSEWKSGTIDLLKLSIETNKILDHYIERLESLSN